MTPDRIVEFLFAGLLGKVPTKIHRVCYVLSTELRSYVEFDGRVDDTNGPLEIEFGDGSLICETATDSERIVVRQEPWCDSFAEPLSEENRQYVAEHGKWVKKDVSDQEPYRALVDAVIDAVVPLTNEFGAIAGVQIGSQQGRLFVFVDGDDVQVASDFPRAAAKPGVEKSFFLRGKPRRRSKYSFVKPSRPEKG